MASGLAFTFVPDMELSYNGVTFPAGCNTDSFRITPVKSADGRTFTHHDFALQVTSYWDTSTPTLVRIYNDVISRLTQPAAGLVYKGRGFGDLKINMPGDKHKDVSFGPWPTVVENVSHNGNVSKLVWSVMWSSLTCGDAVFDGLFAKDLAFELSFDINRFGHTTRTITGFVTIPLTRRTATDRKPPISADDLRERITPALLVGFRRTAAGRFTLSYDRTKLNFHFEDVRFAGAVPPPGVVDASAKHTLTQEGGKPYSWTGTMSSTFALAPGQSAQAALDCFFATLEARANLIRNTGGLLSIVAGTKPKFLPWAFQMGEANMYDDTVVELSSTYKVIGADLRTMLARGGLWTPVPAAHNDARKWMVSMGTVLSARGVDGLVFDTNSDKIVDLCKPDKATVDLKSAPKPAPKGAELRGGPSIIPPSAVRAVFPAPTPADSWLDYKCAIRIEDEHGVIVGTTLPEQPLANSTKPGGFDVAKGKLPAGQEASTFPDAADVGPVDAPNNAAARGGQFVQQRVAPKLFVFIEGEAARHGYEVPCPSLESIGGLPAVPCHRADRGEGFWFGEAGACAAGYPIHAARWKLRYTFDSTASGPRGALKAPPNPLNRPMA